MVRKWFETSYNAILFQKQEDLIRFYNIVYLYCRDCRRLEYLTGKGKMNIIIPASIKVISFYFSIVIDSFPSSLISFYACLLRISIYSDIIYRHALSSLHALTGKPIDVILIKSGIGKVPG